MHVEFIVQTNRGQHSTRITAIDVARVSLLAQLAVQLVVQTDSLEHCGSIAVAVSTGALDSDSRYSFYATQYINIIKL